MLKFSPSTHIVLMTSLPPDTSLRADATALLRVLDAAGNRAWEAIRVVEDFARFVLDDRFLTECCKQLRHDLTAALAPLCSIDRLGARETQADVGTSLTTPAEQHRDDTMAVLSGASMCRWRHRFHLGRDRCRIVGAADRAWRRRCA